MQENKNKQNCKNILNVVENAKLAHIVQSARHSPERAEIAQTGLDHHAQLTEICV